MGSIAAGGASSPSATQLPGDRNVSVYGAAPRDQFYISVTGATIPNPPPLCALFTVTD